MSASIGCRCQKLLFIFLFYHDFESFSIMVIFKMMWYNSNSMDFIRISKKYSFWGNIAHIFLNIILAVIVWFSIYITKTPWIAILLVFISKWRTFTVRPRFWIANVKSNLVDLFFFIKCRCFNVFDRC